MLFILLTVALGAEGAILSNVGYLLPVKWGKPERSVQQALDDAFPKHDFPDGFWSSLAFTEGTYPNQQVGAKGLVKWIEEELLTSGEGSISIPWTQGNASRLAPLEQKQYIAYSRRQVCYIVAKSLIGSESGPHKNALKSFLSKPGPGSCLPRKDGYGRAFWTLLAACSRDPTLAHGAEGPKVVVARGSQVIPPDDLLKDATNAYPLSDAKLRVCRYDDGGGGSALAGVPTVPPSRCKAKSGKRGLDFMTSDGPQGQAMQVMTQKTVGGHIYGVTCSIGGGQSEHVAVYMPEATALSLFLTNEESPQVPTPAWIVGARPILDIEDATLSSNATLQPLKGVRFTSDLVDVQIVSSKFKVSGSKPIVAFSGETEDLLGMSLSPDDVHLARTNRLGKQRDTTGGPLSFNRKVVQYYRGMALESQHPDVWPMLKTVVKSIGIGPWGAGLSFGDSSLSFFAIWIGHAAAAGTWGGSAPELDYYTYSSFLENPSNQCLVHSWGNCKKCIKECNSRKPSQAYWLPKQAYMTWDTGNPCLTGTWKECSVNGIEHIYWNWKNKSGGHLWNTVNWMLWHNRYHTNKGVIDEIMDYTVKTEASALKPLFPKLDIYN
ncbi:Hypothetical protein SCF082_LOCUS39907 [Durusdinium trenchii]|uniref:Uncharacterized protein n=1 Tax=Durusdinium trenchii TaxID=1381693 RepID=A0ABP0Q7V7_9DINO